jgi:hypothetical protein
MKFGNFSAPRFGRCAMEESDHRRRRLLCARRERPCRCRAAEERNKLASPDCGHGHPPPNMTTMNSHTTHAAAAQQPSPWTEPELF